MAQPDPSGVASRIAASYVREELEIHDLIAEIADQTGAPRSEIRMRAALSGGRPHRFDPSYADARRCAVCSQQQPSPIHVTAKEKA